MHPGAFGEPVGASDALCALAPRRTARRLGRGSVSQVRDALLGKHHPRDGIDERGIAGAHHAALGSGMLAALGGGALEDVIGVPAASAVRASRSEAASSAGSAP